MKSKSTPSPARAFLALALSASIGLTPIRASSHMDAPSITLDQSANTTDVYAFVVERNGQKFLDVALAVYPHQEPGVGPNKYNFDPNVLYQIFLANPTTGADLVAYQFQFAENYKTQNTILQSYTGVVGANGDSAQNLTQTYTVTKVVGAASTPLGNGTVPPNNQGIATPRYNKGNDGNQPAKDGVGDATQLDDYTRTAIATLSGGYRSFAGQRDDAFYGDINAIFDLLSLKSGNQRFDSQGGFNVHAIVLEIPFSEIPGGANQTMGVYATTSRRANTVLTDGANSAGTAATGPWVQVGRQGNPLFCEAFIAIKDKDLYNRTKPTSDAALFRTYAENPELGVLINALVLKGNVAPVTNRADLAAIFIPDVIKVDLSTSRARLAGGGATNSVLPDDAGYSRLSIFGGDVLESPVASGHPFRLPGSALGADASKFYVPGGWPNGRRFGEDVIDIGVTAVISDLRSLPLTIRSAAGIDNVDTNDAILNKVFPYSPTPHNGRNYDHNPRQAASPLLNISARGVAGGGANSLIGGFIIRGTQPVQVVVRAMGQSLTAFGVAGALADTTLDLYQGQTIIRTNDDWKSTQQAAITATGYAPGSDSDSAILVTLEPGAYTTIVRGKNGATGVAIVEAFLAQ